MVKFSYHTFTAAGLVPGWIQGLYGLDDLKNADEVIITEGHGQTRRLKMVFQGDEM